MLSAVLYCVFDVKQGPIIQYQNPQLLTKSQFDWYVNLGKVQFPGVKYFPLSDRTKISVFLRNRGC